MMDRAVFNGWIRGLEEKSRQENSMVIAHFLYADDTLVLCEANKENMLNLRIIMILFEGVSGLHVN